MRAAKPTEVEGLVDSINLKTTTPVLSDRRQDYTLDKIKRVVRPSA